MTVCIGAICMKGEAAIVASDRMVTSYYPPIEFEHTKSKIFQITEYCLALTAGDALKPIKMIPRIKDGLGKDPYIESIVDTTTEIYQVLRSEDAEEWYLKPRSMSKEVFYTRGIGIFPQDLFSLIDQKITSHNFGLELLIAGVDNLGAHIYSIRNPGKSDCFDTLGFNAIGVGYLHAIQVFIAHSYKSSYSIEEALNIVYAAKKAAEVAPGVGKEMDISILIGNKTIDVKEEIISELAKIHDEIRKPPAEEIREKSVRLKKLIDKTNEVQEGNSNDKRNKKKKTD